jgi:hypothetical protein
MARPMPALAVCRVIPPPLSLPAMLLHLLVPLLILAVAPRLLARALQPLLAMRRAMTLSFSLPRALRSLPLMLAVFIGRVMFVRPCRLAWTLDFVSTHAVRRPISSANPLVRHLALGRAMNIGSYAIFRLLSSRLLLLWRSCTGRRNLLLLGRRSALCWRTVFGMIERRRLWRRRWARRLAFTRSLRGVGFAPFRQVHVARGGVRSVLNERSCCEMIGSLNV